MSSSFIGRKAAASFLNICTQNGFYNEEKREYHPENRLTEKKVVMSANQIMFLSNNTRARSRPDQLLSGFIGSAQSRRSKIDKTKDVQLLFSCSCCCITIYLKPVIELLLLRSDRADRLAGWLTSWLTGWHADFANACLSLKQPLLLPSERHSFQIKTLPALISS